jgi:hypothetical protein
MTNDFSTEGAFDGTYSTLEERCFNEDVDYDEVTHTSVRFREWHDVAFDNVKEKSGTNRTRVIHSAYMMGLKHVRNVVEISRIHDLAEIRNTMRDVVSNYNHDDYEPDERFGMVLDGDIDDPLTHHGNVTDPTNCYLSHSAYSEVKETFEIDAKFGPWIHRTMVSMGILKSGTCGTGIMRHAKECARAVDGAYEKARRIEEEKVLEYLRHNVAHWATNGIYRGQYEKVANCVELMQTDMSSDCSALLDMIDNNAEVLDDETFR